MKLSTHLLLFILALPLATGVFAQSTAPRETAAPDPRSNTLPSCGGAREAMDRAIAQVQVLDVKMTREVREQILCLLDGVNKTTFDNNSQYDNLYAAYQTRFIVMMYSNAGLDFFAEQLPQQPDRVRRGLSTILLESGHPVAVRRYFEVRRAKLTAGETWDRENSMVGLFGSFLEDGTCGGGLCSEHLAETLTIIQANLDIIDMELAAVEKRLTRQSQSPETAEHAQQERELVSRLRGLVGRIQRGEVAIGTAGRTK